MRHNAQIDKMAALLRDVVRSGGKDNWSHLNSHGHKYATVRSAVGRGLLREVRGYHYEATEDGAAFLVWKAARDKNLLPR